MVDGETYSSGKPASASNKYLVGKSARSNSYYIATKENWESNSPKYIFVAETILSGSGSSDGAEFGGYNSTSGSGASGTAVGDSESNTDIMIAANLSPNTAGHVIAAQWARNSGSYKESASSTGSTNHPACPTTFKGNESVGDCDLPTASTLYTIWQVRKSIPPVNSASNAFNDWPRGGYKYGDFYGTAVISSSYRSSTTAWCVYQSGHQGGINDNRKSYLNGVIAVKELGY